MFIVFEGVDGSGKTTQSKLLFKYLKKKGLKVFLTKEPTKGIIGSFIRKNFLYSNFRNPVVEALLFSGDTYMHLESVIKPMLAKDFIVISDRYFYSNLAYRKAEGLGTDFLLKLNKYALKPDIIFILDTTPNIFMKRLKNKRSKYENKKFLSKVRLEYLKLKQKLHDRIILLNSNESIINIHNRVIKEVEKIL